MSNKVKAFKRGEMNGTYKYVLIYDYTDEEGFVFKNQCRTVKSTVFLTNVVNRELNEVVKELEVSEVEANELFATTE